MLRYIPPAILYPNPSYLTSGLRLLGDCMTDEGGTLLLEEFDMLLLFLDERFYPDLFINFGTFLRSCEEKYPKESTLVPHACFLAVAV